MNKNCKKSLFIENSYMAHVRKNWKMESYNHICEHVYLLNILEEEDRCNQCAYCKFVIELKESLEKNGFFSTHNTVVYWKIKYENECISVTPRN